ncbi:pAbp [Symbiodinium necroappetens]|uniref:PAbp protein n=1 Tax=Symbiodinium necroappetens TaxID=1628268 RepID=A0A812IUL3_9DINO|nr:pAbp [Symbiodinium necroappetens]
MPKKAAKLQGDDGQVKGKKRPIEVLQETSEQLETKPAKASKVRKKVLKEDAPEQPTSKIYISGVPRDCPESSIREKFAKYGTVVEVQIPPDRRRNKKRIAFVGFAESSAAKAALAEDGDLLDSKITVRLAGAKPDPSKLKDVSEVPSSKAKAAKLFITGFGTDADAADALKQHLSKKCGELASFTVPSSRSAKSKGAARGFAIVEFAEIKTAKSALKLNGTSLGGNKLVVKKYEKSRSDEKQMQKQAATKQQQLEKEKAKREFRVVVKGFQKSTTRAELEEHFGSCGEIRTIALPQKDGNPRGIAFVSFSSEAAVQAALKLNAKEFQEKRTLEVWRALEKSNKKGTTPNDGE